MLISCKVTHSVILHLEKQGFDLQPLLEGASLSEEFLRDPSAWMDSHEMEDFLEKSIRLFGSHESSDFLTKVGHSGPELRSWGVLDSVLRMMSQPAEIFTQPERFMSYFISPEPPIEDLIRTETGIEFDLPVSADQYPLTTCYLMAAFESLPAYMGQPLAHGSWKGIHFKLVWTKNQKDLFKPDETEQRKISPDLMRSVLEQLERNQAELSEKRKELRELKQAQKPDRFASLQLDVFETQTLKDFEFIDQNSIELLRQNLMKLSDYMIRAQQLITLMVGQDRQSAQVKAAMKRVDWDRVMNQFPATVKECNLILDQSGNAKTPSQEKSRVSNHRDDRS